jgi:hypothetical protein
MTIFAAVLGRDAEEYPSPGGCIMKVEAQPLTHRVAHEMKVYAGISLYLYVCFGAILLYKESVLEAHDLSYAHYGLAAAKALILGKFLLIGQAIHIGERYKHKPLIYMVLYKSVIFLIVLVALSFLEEIIVGAIHGRTVVETMSEIAGGRWLEIAMTCALLWLILLPYFAFQQISEVLGEGKFRKMLFDKP